MNKNTTILLAIMLAGSIGFLVWARRANVREAITSKPVPVAPTQAATQDLFEEPFVNVVKVEVAREGQPVWVFEKLTDGEPSATGTWRATSPMDMQCVGWEVDRFANELGRLKYEISYRPGEPGAVSPADAGLEPPALTVTLTDTDGNTETIHIGNPASNRETYVKCDSSEEIILAKADLTRLAKDRLIDYREKQVFDFKESDATEVEIVDQEQDRTFRFLREGDRWMIAEPVSARATGKVAEMLSAMARLRALQWKDDAEEAVKTYGLDPAALTVRVTTATEKESPEAADPESEDEPGEDSPPEIETNTYELHVSDRSPIGEDTKTYFRVGDETAVATVMKSVADKFRPDLAEWRDMQITPVAAMDATRIEWTGGVGAAAITRAENAWMFDGETGIAEGQPVEELLQAIDELTAVSFVDAPVADPSTYGLDTPRATIRLTVPGADGTEQISVGDYTDPQTKRLVYVGRNQLATVAKVRASDVTNLLRSPQTYRDRAIIAIRPDQVHRLSIRTPGSEHTPNITLERSGADWTLTAPANAGASSEKVSKLVELLATLRSETIAGEAGTLTAFGLHQPAVRVEIIYSGEAAEEAEPVGEESDRVVNLSCARHDGKAYCLREGRNTVYQVAASLLDRLEQEYRDDRVFRFNPDGVTRFAITSDKVTHAFARGDDRWIYEPEPDLPLDKAKVDNLLVQLQDLRTVRFIRHEAGAVGLERPSHRIEVESPEGTASLTVSGQRHVDPKATGFPASSSTTPGTFLLLNTDLDRFDVKLDNLEAR